MIKEVRVSNRDKFFVAAIAVVSLALAFVVSGGKISLPQQAQQASSYEGPRWAFECSISASSELHDCQDVSSTTVEAVGVKNLPVILKEYDEETKAFLDAVFKVKPDFVETKYYVSQELSRELKQGSRRIIAEPGSIVSVVQKLNSQLIRVDFSGEIVDLNVNWFTTMPPAERPSLGKLYVRQDMAKELTRMFGFSVAAEEAVDIVNYSRDKQTVEVRFANGYEEEFNQDGWFTKPLPCKMLPNACGQGFEPCPQDAPNTISLVPSST